jgi:hypothetical protein
MGSFNIEDFSMRRTTGLSIDEIERRFDELKQIATF